MRRIFVDRFASGFRAAAEKMLPQVVVQEARRLRAYQNNERPEYVKIRVLNALGVTNLRTSRPPRTARKFLFVCFGNIIRSPMCEALMKRELVRLEDRQFSVSSAGLNAVPGTQAYPWAIAAARELGISLEDHRARRLTQKAVEQADVIFVMDYQNRVQLLTRWSTARKKVFMLAAYAGKEYRLVEIPDPYHQGEHQTRLCYQVLNRCIQNLTRSLAA